MLDKDKTICINFSGDDPKNPKRFPGEIASHFSSRFCSNKLQVLLINRLDYSLSKEPFNFENESGCTQRTPRLTKHPGLIAKLL